MFVDRYAFGRITIAVQSSSLPDCTDKSHKSLAELPFEDSAISAIMFSETSNTLAINIRSQDNQQNVKYEDAIKQIKANLKTPIFKI